MAEAEAEESKVGSLEECRRAQRQRGGGQEDASEEEEDDDNDDSWRVRWSRPAAGAVVK